MVKLGSACCRSPCLAAPTREWRIWSLIWVDLCKSNSWMAAGLAASTRCATGLCVYQHLHVSGRSACFPAYTTPHPLQSAELLPLLHHVCVGTHAPAGWATPTARRALGHTGWVWGTHCALPLCLSSHTAPTHRSYVSGRVHDRLVHSLYEVHWVWGTLPPLSPPPPHNLHRYVSGRVHERLGHPLYEVHWVWGGKTLESKQAAMREAGKFVDPPGRQGLLGGEK